MKQASKILNFHKYHGTGNDFVLIDNREKKYDSITQEHVKFICHRKFGIGSDGFILLEDSAKCDFAMRYFNSDGQEATMCGNGGRCIVLFAKHLGIIDDNATFEAVDGIHSASVLSTDIICLEMPHCQIPVKISENRFFIDTGSPHVVIFNENIDKIDIAKEGKKIRLETNANVNFCEIDNGTIQIRTFERGVEDETLSCGTGSIAAAIVATVNGYLKKSEKIEIITKGGTLWVSFNYDKKIGKALLFGQAKKVFIGKIEI